MLLKSRAFENNGVMPQQYTCQGGDISPPLSWQDIPEQAESFVLICDDPDAPHGWVHWVLYDIPVRVNSLPEALPGLELLSNGAYQGKNDFKRIGYGGPCPPQGCHRYFFKLYAIDKRLNMKPGATKPNVLEAMEGHVLSECELMGKYQKVN